MEEKLRRDLEKKYINERNSEEVIKLSRLMDKIILEKQISNYEKYKSIYEIRGLDKKDK
ncbi:hypothetical protein [Clostridium sartagoforme]|jgi:hypothetical protein|uniref:hypothetical protein n=1 Tax=Clostridium sartagoforme TaxID=84031 RepID=UPI0031DE7777